MITFDVPNLDGATMDPMELADLAKTLNLLSEYAACKTIAMRYRLRGLVANAMLAERRCEYVYQQLPEWARW